MGFSSGFNSGFSVAVEAEPKVRHGGGVPAVLPTRRRGQPVELEGFGLITVIGTGALAIERAIAGAGPLVMIGQADLVVDLTDESLTLALLGIPPDSEQGIALWLGLN